MGKRTIDNHMDVSQLVQQKLTELGLEQRDLADAAEVTESYISQLLSRKKMPPAPERTDIYDKLGRFLKLPAGKLARLADVQRKQELKKKIQSPPVPLSRCPAEAGTQEEDPEPAGHRLSGQVC